jgi:hypothetical protein
MRVFVIVQRDRETWLVSVRLRVRGSLAVHP